MGDDAWNGIWFSSFYFALAKMTYAIQTSKAPSLHKFPVILAIVEWAVTNSLFGGFLVALSAQLGEAKAENIQTADPAFIRDSWVSCGLWACSAHSSDVAKQALGGLIHMKHDCSQAETFLSSRWQQGNQGGNCIYWRDVLGVWSDVLRGYGPYSKYLTTGTSKAGLPNQNECPTSLQTIGESNIISPHFAVLKS